MGEIMKAVKSLFKTPKLPNIDTPVMPDPGSAAAKLAAGKKTQRRRAAGREGTIFTGAYSNANLGGTA